MAEYGLNHGGFLRLYGVTFVQEKVPFTYLLPMSSLSVSSRSGAPSAITAVIPYTVEIANWIGAIQAASLEVYREQTGSSGQTDTALVESAAVVSVRSDIGGKNASITLRATSTKTHRTPRAVTLHGLSYVSVVDGKQRVRCAPCNDLTVGDTVLVGAYVLVADNIQLSVSPTLEQMEIYE
jgi:hypothetical protein